MPKLSYWLVFPPIKFLMRVAFAVLGGLKRSGAQNIPRRGGVLICPNHVCDADPPALALTLPRSAYFMAKEELFTIPILGKLIHWCQGFPVRRESADRAALKRAETLLKAGEAVVIFPEGGGNPEGVLQPLHPGALLLALRARVPVIPVALVDTNKIWPYGDTFPRRAGVPARVTFGEPLDLSDLYGARGAVETATGRLTEQLALMLGQPVPVGKPKSQYVEENDAPVKTKPVAVVSAQDAAAAPSPVARV